MFFEISHTTFYRYGEPVFLEPHVLRLRPRSDPFQRLDRFELAVVPQPSGATQILDAENNPATVVWFEGTTDRLEIRTAAAVETLRANPFDYLVIAPEAQHLPARYPPEDERALGPYRASGPKNSVTSFALDLAAVSQGDTLGFLAALNGKLYREWGHEVREEGDPYPAEQTLREQRGSCRDLTVLFMAACRSVGLAARFVSGYQEGDPTQEQRHMHAWPEVFLPGAGWRGYDPTHGLAVADRPVALAASAEPAGAAPSRGSFRGRGSASEMEARIAIHTRPSLRAATQP